MIIVISNPTLAASEHLIINQLFGAGLDIFHLRKPGVSEEGISALLDKLDSKYYSKIALHQHHSLAERYNLKRLHYTETNRKSRPEADLQMERNSLRILSTSIHHIDDYEKISECFDYCFFGPVFNSISKQGYLSVVENDFIFIENKITKVVALGGVGEGNIEQVKKMGFSGMALLGAIWQSKDPIGKFNRIKEKWQTIKLVY